MPAYSYTVVNELNQKSTGIIEADNAKFARQKLRSQGFFPLEITEISDEQNSTKPIYSPFQNTRLKKISSSSMVLATRQLATLLQARLTVEESLSALIEQSETVRVQRAFAAVRSEVRSGHSLSQSVRQFPQIFPEIYRATIRAGEESGNLSAVMLKLADYLEKRQEVSRKVMSAFAYPIIVCVVAILVIVALFVFVVPQIVAVFESSKSQLPLITKVMLATSGFLKAYGIYLCIVFSGAYLFFLQALKIDSFRYAYHQVLLKTPIVRKVILSSDSVRLTNTLAILVGSGVPLLTSIGAAADNLVLLPLKNAMKQIIEEIREGKSFSKALETAKKFPPVLTYLVRSGEATGEMAQMLERAAYQQENELESRLSLMTTILGPLLIVIMGAVVGAIVLSVLLPIADINQMVR